MEERNWATIAHLAALLGLVVPVGNILGPLLVWMIKKDSAPFVDHHGKEALNFQIFITILLLGLGFVIGMGIVLALVLIGIPILLMAAIAVVVVGIVAIVLVIVASVEANRGNWYRYAFSYRFIR